jgi:hypothetical protein
LRLLAWFTRLACSAEKRWGSPASAGLFISPAGQSASQTQVCYAVNGMMDGMMSGMGIIGLLPILVPILAIAALIKYLLSRR